MSVCWRGCLLIALVVAACDGGRSGGPAAATSAATTGIDATTDGSTAVRRGPIEMFSWWARVGEADALGALMQVHSRKHPSDSMINASAELSGLARKTLRTRLLRDDPPDTFQANIGYDLMQWVKLNGLDARESKLAPLDRELVEVGEWRKVFPQLLIDDLSCDGKMYAVPSNVHRINTVFYNKRVFAQHGLQVPRTIEELVAMGHQLQGSKIPLIALGSREPWTLALLVFECLLVAREGPGFYTDYLRGSSAPDEPRVLRTLGAALELLEFANSDHRELSWLQALERVVRGRAAMTVMGDWARVSLNAHGLKLGADYGEFAFPATEGTFVYTSDTFALPHRAKNKAGAKRLLVTIGSREGQKAMNDARGALSARLDVQPPNDPVLREKRRLMGSGPMALALSGIVPSRFADDLGAALAEMAEERDIEPVVHTLRSRYPLLR